MTKIKLESAIQRTPRVMQLEGMFDLEPTASSITEIPLNFPDLNERPWNVGLIVGPSGAGKSTVARHLFGDVMKRTDEKQWSHDKAVVDDFPAGMSIRDVTELLSSVGFSSPPAWLRPFHALSNGEQFRVTMAYILATESDLAVVDEFTSVIDRTVAKIGSAAIAKTVRRRGQKFVAVGCHYDIQEWLQPDWIYEPSTGKFTWGSVQPRPRVEIRIFRANYEAWQSFSRHHYLDHKLNPSAHLYVATIDGQPAIACAVMPLVHGVVKNAKRISRIVTLPDFQGIGLAGQVLDAIGGGLKDNGYSLYLTTSHPAMIGALNHRNTWTMVRKPSRVAKAGKNKDMAGLVSSRGRLTTTFRYAGDTDERLLPILAGERRV